MNYLFRLLRVIAELVGLTTEERLYKLLQRQAGKHVSSKTIMQQLAITDKEFEQAIENLKIGGYLT